MLKRLGMLAGLLVLLVAAGIAAERFLAASFRAPGPARATLRVEVPAGVSVRGVLAHLAASGALRHPRLTELYLRLHGRRFSIKAGEYDIPAHASAAQVIELLAEGRVVLEQVTVIEGSTFADFRRALESQPKIRSTLRGRPDAELMSVLGHPGQIPEGLFFPDTYRFAAGTADVEILKLAYERMQAVLAQAWSARHADLPLATPYQALILASIVEKETGLPAERARIAGVFIARMRKGMRLQSDPTVIYGMGEHYDGTIRTRDLTTDTPYNTYTRGGLPPTPIALPGGPSIFAAVQPEDRGELYFVALGDGSGAHQFSATLEQHNLAVQHYLTRLRAQAAGAQAAATRGKP